LYTLGKGLQLSIASLTINLYAYSLGYRGDFIGLLTAMPALGSFVVAVPMGILTDRLGRKPMILIGAFLTPLTLVAIAISTSAPLLLAASFINGLAAGAYWVSNLPMLTESATPAQRSTVIALNTFLLLGVGALGSLIGGVVPELAATLLGQPATAVEPLRWGVLAAGIVTIVPAIPLIWLREPRRAGGVPVAASDAATPHHDPEAMPVGGITRRFVQLLVPDVILVMGESMVIGLLQLYFALRFQLQPGPLGIFLAIAGFGGGAAALLAPRMVRRWGTLRTSTALYGLSVPVVLAIGLAPGVAVAGAAETTRGILRGMAESSYTTFAMESVPARFRGTLSGFYGVTWGVGFSVGAALAGVLQQHVSLAAPFFLGAAMLGIASFLLWIFFGRRTA
jgi:MFS family permease